MGHVVTLELQALWKILTVGLLLGAGLPVLFSVGIRAMAYGAGGAAETSAGGTVAAPRPIGRVIGFVCFAIVGLCVALGLTYIIATGFGKTLGFEHVYPTIVSKS
jgi:hypothetical protein